MRFLRQALGSLLIGERRVSQCVRLSSFRDGRWLYHRAGKTWRPNCCSVLGLAFLILALGSASEGTGWAQNRPALVGTSASTIAVFPFTGSSAPSRRGFTDILSGEGLKVGPVRVHPFLGAAVAYTDNTFRTNSNRENDFVYTVAPGIQAWVPLAGRHRFMVDYRAAKQFNERFPNNDVLSQDVYGRLTFDFPGRLNIDLQGGHTEGYDPRGTVADIQAFEPTKWNTTSFIGEVEAFGSRTGIRLRARSIRWNFENNNQGPIRDRLANSADLTLFGSVTSKTLALISFGVEERIFDQNRQLDSVTYGIRTGLRWAATGKTTGEIQVGYEVFSFDRAQVEQPPGSQLSSGGNGEQTPSVRGNLRWQPTSRLTINLKPYRTIRQTAVFNTSFFTQTGFTLWARQATRTRITVMGNYRFESIEFSEPAGGETTTRDDLAHSLGLGLEYRALKWLGLRLEYRFQQRSSNIDRFEFYANTLMLSVQGML